MKKLMLRIIALAVFSGGAWLAQDITGTWQGTISSPKEQRVVIKISKAEGGFKAVEYKIDQAPQGVAATVTLRGSSVKITVPAIEGAYEGKLDPGGKLIVGAWIGGLEPVPMKLTLATSNTAWEIPKPPLPRKSMAADADPVFEVATIKPIDPNNPNNKIYFSRAYGRHFEINSTLFNFLTYAYALHPGQIAGGPAWIDKDRFAVSAQSEGEGDPKEEQWKIMLQKLLADRFQLKFHIEKKELSVYAIVLGKTGPKLSPTADPPSALPLIPYVRFVGEHSVMPARNVTIADLAHYMLSVFMDRPVVDQTGLSGRYDFKLTWMPDTSQFGGMGGHVPQDDGTPDLFTAMQQELGLKLESVKAPVDVLVIDHAERPSEN